MTAPVREGLTVAARVHRGSFTLRARVAAAPGEVIAVLGPNGSGKSTLLGTLAGLVPLTAGRIVLDGTVLDDADIGDFVEAAHRPVGFVFQDHRLFPRMSVLDNVAFSPSVRGLSRAGARSVAGAWLTRLGLSDLAGQRPAQLSGGQAQRVALARALAGDPALLLLDEPLAALDARTRLDVQTELRRHLADFAGPCLFVTHDPLDALVLADRLVVLENGRVVQEGMPAEVARRPATEYVAKLVGLNLYCGVAAGSSVVLDEGGSFVVADHEGHGAVLVALRPSAVTVSSQPPRASSARNTWPATISGLTLLTDRVRLDLDGEPSALVDVTPAAVADLGLGAGRRVWLSAKAVDLEVYRRSATERHQPDPLR
jgi:molybdate transport system ATP-binding protein